MEKSMYYSAYGAILVSISNDVKSITKSIWTGFCFSEQKSKTNKARPFCIYAKCV